MLGRSADIVSEARQYAEAKHMGQKKKYADKPYFNHVEAVVDTLRRAGIDDAITLAAAYLHDVVEKSDTKLHDIARQFGADVAELVFWLTDPEDDDETVLLPVWRLSRAPMQAKLIKFADIIDNAARKRAHAPHEAFKAWADEKALILERMIEVDVSRLAEQPLFQRARTAITSP